MQFQSGPKFNESLRTLDKNYASFFYFMLLASHEQINKSRATLLVKRKDLRTYLGLGARALDSLLNSINECNWIALRTPSHGLQIGYLEIYINPEIIRYSRIPPKNVWRRIKIKSQKSGVPID